MQNLSGFQDSEDQLAFHRVQGFSLQQNIPKLKDRNKLKKFMQTTNFSITMNGNSTSKILQDNEEQQSLADDDRIINVRLDFQKLRMMQENSLIEKQEFDDEEQSKPSCKRSSEKLIGIEQMDLEEITNKSLEFENQFNNEEMNIQSEKGNSLIIHSMIKDIDQNYESAQQKLKSVTSQSSPKTIKKNQSEYSRSSQSKSKTDTSQEQISFANSSSLDKSKDESSLSFIDENNSCMKKIKKTWNKFLFAPTNKAKVKWDLVIILLSIWNALTMPVQFAFPELFENNTRYKSSEYGIDLLFAFDIVMNFRTGYRDSKTDALIMNGKKIALNYIKGRFWVDLLASMPIDYIMMIFSSPSGNSKRLKMFRLMKLVRLLRLGRIVTYLQMNSSFKFGMKFAQLLFMLLLIVHWIACIWFDITGANDTWYPPKDNSLENTIFYEEGYVYQYSTLFYYAVLTLIGSDLIPSQDGEMILSTLVIILGSIILGTIIGEFSSILSQMSQKARIANEEFDMVSSIMVGLKIPEEIQARVLEYYENLTSAKFVRNEKVYEVLNLCLSNNIRLFQMEQAIRKMGLFDQHNMVQIEHFAQNAKIQIFLPGDVIVKQGDSSNYFYFIIDGIVEVILENTDFKFFDFHKAKNYINEKSKLRDRQAQKHQNEGKKKSRVFPPQFVSQKQELEQDTDLTNTKSVLLKKQSGIGDSFSTSNFQIKLLKTHHQEEENAVSNIMSNRTQMSDNKLLQQENFDEKNNYPKEQEDVPIRKMKNDFRVVNELKDGDYFGEIGLLTNLNRTCSIFTVSQTICGVVSKEDFKDLINTNADFKNKLYRKMNNYNDSYFKFLVTMVRNVFAFRTISSQVMRSVVYLLQEKRAIK